jgi:hypothetical protein
MAVELCIRHLHHQFCLQELQLCFVGRKYRFQVQAAVQQVLYQDNAAQGTTDKPAEQELLLVEPQM